MFYLGNYWCSCSNCHWQFSIQGQLHLKVQEEERSFARRAWEVFQAATWRFWYLQWWVGRQSQFPSLYCLARDMFSIPGTFPNSLIHIKHWHHLPPGSAVAVEHIFSGGRDTISLRCASLQPETIRTLMLVKQWLRLSRLAIDKAL
jgi:hypothetical protein